MDDRFVEITVIYFDGCPSWRVALERLQEALVAMEPDPMISTIEVSSEAEAQAAGFAGSPTILIDGTDLFPIPHPSPALACRLYATPAGLAGSPTMEQIAEAFIERTRS